MNRSNGGTFSISIYIYMKKHLSFSAFVAKVAILTACRKPQRQWHKISPQTHRAQNVRFELETVRAAQATNQSIHTEREKKPATRKKWIFLHVIIDIFVRVFCANVMFPYNTHTKIRNIRFNTPNTGTHKYYLRQTLKSNNKNTQIMAPNAL